MAVDRGYGKGPGKTQVNYANGGGRDGYGFQGGSTFKAFDLAAALQKGLPLSTAIASPPLYLSPVFKTYEDGRRVPYQVRNAEPNEGGIFTMRRATELSVNTYFMQLAERTGLEAPIALAEALGVSRKVPGGQTPLERNPSTVLGAQVVSPLAMAGAYATFAARGIYCPPRATLAIEGPDGPLDLPPSGCGRALDQGIADTVTDVLRGVVTSGTGRDAAIGRPVAGKTGTTNESKAAWFVGYTPQLATAVWVGLPDRLGRPLPMRGVTIADRYYQVMYGGNLPASIWQQTMSTALDGVEEVDFPRPSREVLNEEVAGAGVPDVTGLSYDAAAAALAAQGFSATRGTSVAGSGRPPGSVVRTAPGPGSQVSANRIVYVYAAA